MSALIHDPFDRTEAIVAETGRMAGRVFVGKVPNPEAPTVADINAMTFVGFMTDTVDLGWGEA